MSMNPMDFLKNFQNLQSKMNEMQENLKSLVVTGSSGGGMVEIEMDGQLDIKKVKIAPEVVDPNDIEMFQDLIMAAVNQAKEKAQELQQETMAGMTGGLNIPGLNLPF